MVNKPTSPIRIKARLCDDLGLCETESTLFSQYCYTMDSSDYFRKLTVGVKFNLKRFEKDARTFKLIKSKEQDLSSLSSTSCESSGLAGNGTNNIENDIILDDKEVLGRMFFTYSTLLTRRHFPFLFLEEELTILGNMTSRSTKSREQKKMQKKNNRAKNILRETEEMNHFRNVNKIKVTGSDIPDPSPTFENMQQLYKISKIVSQNILNEEYKKPTPIQMQAIPVMILRREILACAPTGSGKTVAFLLPLISHLKGPQKKGFRAVIVSPSRELARQTYQECLRLSRGTDLRTYFIDKGSKATKTFGPESSKKFDIMITTPNKLVYLLNQDPPILDLTSVEFLVIDEADKLFEFGKRGFRDQLAVIYKACDSANVRRAMFSATFTSDVENWCKLNLDDPIMVSVGIRNSATNLVNQEILFVGDESGKMIAFRDMVQKGKLEPPVLVFVQTKERAKELFRELIYDGINVDVIHSERSQQQRDNVVKCFRAGKIWVLIATELMGRGIDFKGVNLVVNYDFPPTAISYIHRIGRTGRAGRKGKAVTYFTEDDFQSLRSIAQVMRNSGCKVPKYMLEIKKPTQKEKRHLATHAPKRKSINTESLYDQQKKKRKRQAIESSLKKKKIEKDD
ncbi:putative ATP-dependent RNA helicase DDX52 [Nymphon striatum]|nr:putative ATP-dependent RNA helicase DDX52 [Nymphon striatum]